MSCDHAPARASILVFRESTMFIGFQDLGEGQTAMLGNCRRCKSTIAIEIDVARGHVVHGEIGAMPGEPHVSTPVDFNDPRISPPPSRYHFEPTDEPPPVRRTP